MGNGLQNSQILWDFVSQCEVWHVCLLSVLNMIQIRSEEANWSGSALFVIKYVNFYQKPRSSNQIGWKLEVGVAS